MEISYWCILIAGLLPILTVWVAKYGRRADYAHRNHFEAFPFFAAAVLVAQQTGVAQEWIDGLALAFIAARMVYTALYLNDLPSLRSLSWTVGYACVLGLFAVSALHL
jgi:uncharacterized MAPEG superfamily protein